MFNRFFDRFRKHNQAERTAQLCSRPTQPVVSVNAEPTYIPPQTDAEHNRDCVRESVADGVPPERLACIQKMGKNIHYVMRMAAMKMLRPEGGGYVMEIEGETVRMPDAATLFEAYLVLEAMYGFDWTEIYEALEAPWASEVIRMLDDRERYRALWQDLRRQTADEESNMLKKHGDINGPIQRSAKVFTLLALDACGKIIDTLSLGIAEGEA